MDIFLYKMLLASHYHTVVWWSRGKMVQSQQQRLWEAQILGVRELTEQTHLLGTLGKLLYPFPGPRDPCHLEPVLSLLYWLRPSDVTVSSVSRTEMAPSWLKGSYRGAYLTGPREDSPRAVTAGFSWLLASSYNKTGCTYSLYLNGSPS